VHRGQPNIKGYAQTKISHIFYKAFKFSLQKISAYWGSTQIHTKMSTVTVLSILVKYANKKPTALHSQVSIPVVILDISINENEVRSPFFISGSLH
jgi:hypothetical protein